MVSLVVCSKKFLFLVIVVGFLAELQDACVSMAADRTPTTTPTCESCTTDSLTILRSSAGNQPIEKEEGTDEEGCDTISLSCIPEPGSNLLAQIRFNSGALQTGVSSTLSPVLLTCSSSGVWQWVRAVNGVPTTDNIANVECVFAPVGMQSEGAVLVDDASKDVMPPASTGEL